MGRKGLDALDDVAEDLTDGRAEEGQDDDDDDGDEYQDQSVLNQTLGFFFRGK